MRPGLRRGNSFQIDGSTGLGDARYDDILSHTVHFTELLMFSVPYTVLLKYVPLLLTVRFHNFLLNKNDMKIHMDYGMSYVYVIPPYYV